MKQGPWVLSAFLLFLSCKASELGAVALQPIAPAIDTSLPPVRAPSVDTGGWWSDAGDYTGPHSILSMHQFCEGSDWVLEFNTIGMFQRQQLPDEGEVPQGWSVGIHHYYLGQDLSETDPADTVLEQGIYLEDSYDPSVEDVDLPFVRFRPVFSTGAQPQNQVRYAHGALPFHCPFDLGNPRIVVVVEFKFWSTSSAVVNDLEEFSHDTCIMFGLHAQDLQTTQDYRMYVTEQGTLPNRGAFLGPDELSRCLVIPWPLEPWTR